MIRNVKVGKEIVVTSANKVGVLSQIAKILASKGINIIAISAQSAGGVALVNIVVDDHTHACDTLRKKKFPIHESNVLLVDVTDKPGVLKQMTERLATKKIDLLNIYGSTSSTYGPCALVLSTSDNQKAKVVLFGLT